MEWFFVLAANLLKLEIFHTSRESNSNFVIDFRNNEAYYNPTFDLMFKDKIHLSDKEVTNFLNSIDEFNFIEELQNIECHVLKYFEPTLDSEYYFHTLKIILHNDVIFSNQWTFICYFEDFTKEYNVQWCFPSFWYEFAEVLMDLVGYDILNINDSKKWLNNLNYEFRDDGIFDNGNKLKLKSFKFVYNAPHIIDDSSSSFFIIDFIKCSILGKNSILCNDVSRDVLDEFLDLITKYEIYKWAELKQWSNVYNELGGFCDGYRWSIELIFDNDSIFYIKGHCRHPDLYFPFAKEVKSLFSKDILRLEDCAIPDKIKYADLFK